MISSPPLTVIINVVMKFKTALVTGGAGFIGSNLVEELLNQGMKVICLDDLSKGNLENIYSFLNNPNFTFIINDITNYDSIRKYFINIDIVFHLACSKCTVCLKDPARDLLVNALGSYNVLKVSQDSGVKRFIHISTGSVYGEPKIFPQDETHPLNPTSYYGVSKLAGERYANTFYRLYNFPVTILRYYHVYGPKQDCSDEGGVVAVFANRLIKNKPITIYGDGTQERSFTYVKDVVKATIFVSEREDTIGQIYNVASGLKISINKLAKSLKNLTTNDLNIIYKDWKLGDIKRFDVSNQKLTQLGFEFRYSFKQGLIKTVNWYKND